MKIALIADTHGNGVALDAVLEDVERQQVDTIVCLGDVVYGGAEPKRTVDRVRELGCPVVMGNTDAFLLDRTVEAEKLLPREFEVRDWTVAQLDDSDLEFIREFQPTVTITVGAPDGLLCFHGSPSSYLDIILPWTSDEEVEAWLDGTAGRFFAGGHTHLQQLRRLGSGLFVNPGSVGMVFDVRTPVDAIRISPWAEYAILTLDGGTTSVDFKRIPFDVGEMARGIRGSGRPHADELLLQFGVDQ